MQSFHYLILALASFAISHTDPLSPSSQHIENDQLKSNGISKRSDDTTKRQYIIIPNNGTDSDANSKIENFLKSTTQQTNIFSAKYSPNNLIWWLANITDSKVDTVRKYPGQYT